MQIPISFIDITEKVGKDINLVQGPGGNISYKDNGYMYIKASGTKMSDVKKKNIFVKTNYKKILSAISNEDLDPVKNSWEEDNGIRPSIETSMHAIMPHKFVLHVHCVNTLSWIVQKNYPNKLNSILKGENWSSVPYRKPGICLSKEIKKVIDQNKSDIILLSNHGIVAGADTPEKVYGLIKRISQKLYLGELGNNKINVTNFNNYLLSEVYKLPRFEYVHQIAFSRKHTLIATKGTLFPDQIVFLENGIVIINNVKDFKNLLKLRRNNLPVILIPNIGILVPNDFNEVNENILLGLSMIISRIPINSSIKYLKKREIDELLNWDLEKHRQKINN